MLQARHKAIYKLYYAANCNSAGHATLALSFGDTMYSLYLKATPPARPRRSIGALQGGSVAKLHCTRGVEHTLEAFTPHALFIN
jgi:hypothetical protein